MAFSNEAESILSRVFGRSPDTSEQRSFLASASQRKTGGALQGAIESSGLFGGQAGTQQTADPLDQAFERLQNVGRKLQKISEKQTTVEIRSKLKEDILSNPAIQELIKQRGERAKQIQEVPAELEGSELATPTQQGALQGQALGSLLQRLSDVSGAIQTRGTAVNQILENIRLAEQEKAQGLQQQFTAQQGIVSSLIQGRQEQRAQGLFPGQLTTQQLQQQQLQQQISGTVPFTKGELIQIGEKFADPQAVMDFIQNRRAAGTANRPQRNNNPLNLKIGGLSQQFVDQGLATIEARPAQDGGNFLTFNSPQDGFAAAQSVLFKTDFYGNRTVDNAMRTWSGGGYGAEITGVSPGKLMRDLNVKEQQDIVMRMAKREGFFAGAPKDIFAPRAEPGKIAQIIAETKAREIAKREVERQFPKEADAQAKNLASAGTIALNNAKSMLGFDPSRPDASLKSELLVRSRVPGGIVGGRQLRAALDSMLLNYVFMLSGKQVSEKEIGRFEKIGLQAGDSDATVRFKIGQFETMFQRVLGGGAPLGITLNELENFTPNDVQITLNALGGAGQGNTIQAGGATWRDNGDGTFTRIK